MLNRSTHAGGVHVLTGSREQRREITRPAKLATIACLVACAVLGGCQVYSDPGLSVIKAEATERTPEGVGMVFTLDAKNDNDVPLPLRDVDYALSLDGRQVFTGTRSAEQTLRRSGTQQVRLPAVVNLTRDDGIGSSSGVVRYRLSGTMRYVTPGQIAEVLFDQGVRVPSVSFSQEGEMDLTAARTVALALGVGPINPPVQIELLSLPNTPGPVPTPIMLAESAGQASLPAKTAPSPAASAAKPGIAAALNQSPAARTAFAEPLIRKPAESLVSRPSREAEARLEPLPVIPLGSATTQVPTP